MLATTSSENPNSCKICGQLAIGQNFGALSCRACAAFFRRNALNGLKFPRCLKNDLCKPKSDGKFYCKKCRLEKCLKAGMDVKKFQEDRDVLRTASNFRVPPSMSNFLGRPSTLLICEPTKSSHLKVLIDVSGMVDRVERILRASLNAPRSLSSLEKLSVQLGAMRKSATRSDELMVVGRIDKRQMLRTWEDAFVDTATWIVHFEEFRELPEKIKLTIVKRGWLLWSKLEKLAETAAYLKKQLISNGVIMIADGFGVDQNEIDVDLSWMTNYTKEQARQFNPLDLNNNLSNILSMLIELEPTSIELSYMLSHLCLFMAGKRHVELCHVTDGLLEVQANSLHEYYKRSNCSKYAERVAKMMKVNNLLMRDMWERNERNHLARVFRLYCFEFSDDAMFEGL